MTFKTAPSFSDVADHIKKQVPKPLPDGGNRDEAAASKGTSKPPSIRRSGASEVPGCSDIASVVWCLPVVAACVPLLPVQLHPSQDLEPLPKLPAESIAKYKGFWSKYKVPTPSPQEPHAPRLKLADLRSVHACFCLRVPINEVTASAVPPPDSVQSGPPAVVPAVVEPPHAPQESTLTAPAGQIPPPQAMQPAPPVPPAPPNAPAMPAAMQAPAAPTPMAPPASTYLAPPTAPPTPSPALQPATPGQVMPTTPHGAAMEEAAPARPAFVQYSHGGMEGYGPVRSKQSRLF